MDIDIWICGYMVRAGMVRPCLSEVQGKAGGGDPP